MKMHISSPALVFEEKSGEEKAAIMQASAASRAGMCVTL